MRGRRGLLEDLGLLATAQILAQLLNLAALVILARHLGGHDFGLVQVGVAVSAYAMLTAEWGLFSLGVRDVARLQTPAEILAYARAQQGLLVVLAFIVMGLGFLVLPAFPFFHEDPLLFYLYVLMVVPQILAQEWIATGREHMLTAGVGKVAASAVYALLIAFALRPADGEGGWPAYRWVPVMYLVSFAAGSLVVAAAARRWLGGWVRPGFAPVAVWQSRMAGTAPLGASLLLMRVLINGDLILLGILSDPETAGIYAAAAKIGFLVVVAMEVLWKALLPRLSRLAAGTGGGDSPEFAARVRTSFTLVAALLIPLAAAGVVWGPRLLVLFCGDGYARGGPIFQVLSVSYVMLALGWFLGYCLLAAGRQREGLWPLALAAVAAVAAHIVFIPRWAGVGAAWAMLVGHSVLLGAMAVAGRRWFDGSLRGPACLIALAASAMVLVMRLAAGQGMAVSAGLGLTAYILVTAVPMRRSLSQLLRAARQ